MSMSQEEIEALMNGGDDFSPDENETKDEEKPSEAKDEQSGENETQDESKNEEASSDDSSVSDDQGDDNFDDILAGIDGITDDDSEQGDDNFDDILAGIDGVTDDSSDKNDESSVKQEEKKEDKSDSRYPLPVEKEHKVVNQLTEVAEDSEQKASQIFDVLSYILDENNEIATYHKKSSEFLTSQVELLESLSNKFPNIDVFKTNLDAANSLQDLSKESAARIDNENMKIFEAMELMQYHDINRQKIERVMAVIRKLNDYLNGIFEDDSGKPEVQVAKHIDGDSNETVEAEDLEALINEFANEEK